MFPDYTEEEVQTYMQRVREEEDHLMKLKQVPERSTDQVKTGKEFTKNEEDTTINIDSGTIDNKNRNPKLKSPK